MRVQSFAAVSQTIHAEKRFSAPPKGIRKKSPPCKKFKSFKKLNRVWKN
jgi:hypothetical protein